MRMRMEQWRQQCLSEIEQCHLRGGDTQGGYEIGLDLIQHTAMNQIRSSGFQEVREISTLTLRW